MEHQFLTMLRLQEKINSKVDPAWRKSHYNFARAGWIECAELMDHYGYKWWKKQTPDMDQVKLEVVDIWHFLLSIFLSEQDVTIEDISLELASYFRAHKFSSSHVLRDAEEMARTFLTTKCSYDLSRSFFALMFSSEMDFDELFRLYVGKNILNIFRQDHGYKSGTYIKIWNGREDNVYLQEILRTLDSKASSFDQDVYNRLSDVYVTLGQDSS